MEGKKVQDVIHTTLLNIWKSWRGKRAAQWECSACSWGTTGQMPADTPGCAASSGPGQCREAWTLILGHWPSSGWGAPAKQILNGSLEGWLCGISPCAEFLDRKKKKRLKRNTVSSNSFSMIQCGVHREGQQEPSYLNGLIYTGNNLGAPGSGKWSSGLWNCNNWEGRYPWAGNRLRTGNNHFSVTFLLYALPDYTDSCQTCYLAPYTGD